MMTLLDTITTHKKKEVAARKKAFPLSLLEQSRLYHRSCVSLSQSIVAGSGIIAEHKRKSPSKAVINNKSDVVDVTKGYEKAGVSAISVLTDTQFFGGSLDDLLVARTKVTIPLLRKDFIIDSYQIYEAKAYGADAILLIVACLTPQQLRDYAMLANQLGLEILVEVHSEKELIKASNTPAHLLGVNNRDLKTFEVSLEISKQLAPLIPSQFVKVSESGISSVEAIQTLKKYNYQGFLMGEQFMKQQKPGKSVRQFIHEINKQSQNIVN